MINTLKVATVFANESGLILEIEQSHALQCPYYFNCTLLSAYSYEDERLFIGGAGYGRYRSGDLRFRSIRIIKNKKNYFWYIRALSLFNMVVTGGELKEKDRKKQFVKSIKWYFDIIDSLLKCNENINDNNNKYPSYVIKTFQKFLNHKKRNIILFTMDE